MMPSIIKTKKGEIEYSLRGRGKPILFVHGGHVDCKETIFQKGLNLNKFCVLTPSRPGYGKTPLTETNKTPKEAADLFIALLDTLDIAKVVIVGISAGGLTALEITANYPDRVEHLILMSALTKKWFTNNKKIFILEHIFHPRIESYLWSAHRLFFKILPKLIAKLMFMSLSKDRPVVITKDELTEVRRMSNNMRSREGFRNDLHQDINQQTLSKIQCQTLILHSENDHAVDLSHPYNAKKRIKNATLVTFKTRWGHLLWIGKEYQDILYKLEQQIS